MVLSKEKLKRIRDADPNSTPIGQRQPAVRSPVVANGGGQRPREPEKTKKKTNKAAYILAAISLILFIAGIFSMANIAGLAVAIIGLIAVIIVMLALFRRLVAGKAHAQEKDVKMWGESSILGPTEVWIIVAMIVLALMIIIFTIAYNAFLNPWDNTRALFGALGVAGIFGFIIVYLILESVVTISASPHSLGLIMFLGSKTKYRVKDGRYPSIPGILEYLIMPARKIDQDFKPFIAMTIDGVRMRISPKMNWRVNPDDMVDYEIAGQEEGVRKLIDNVVPQFSAKWVNARTHKRVLELKNPDIKEIMEELIKKKEEGALGGTESVAGKLGIIIIDFNMNAELVDKAVIDALMQPTIETAQQESEMKELETEKKFTDALIEGAKKYGRDADRWLDTYWEQKDRKTGREAGVPPVPGLSGALKQGRAGVADLFALSLGGMMKKPTEGKALKVSKGQQRPLDEGEAIQEEPTRERKEKRRKK